MRRGSFRRRLPRGRLHRRKINPVLPGAAILLILLVSATLYFLPQILPVESLIKFPGSSHSEKAAHVTTDDLPGQVLKIASANEAPANQGLKSEKKAEQAAALSATVKPSGEGVTQVYLENKGQATLQHICVLEESGRTLGILSQLSPGEKKVLAMSGPARRIRINAFDQSGREVPGDVRYDESSAPISFSGGSGDMPDVMLEAKSAIPETETPETEIAETKKTIDIGHSAQVPRQSGAAINESTSSVDQGISAISQSDAAVNQSASQLHSESNHSYNQSVPIMGQVPACASEAPMLFIEVDANRTEGHYGDAVGYVCTAKNCGNEELSDVKLFCQGEVAETLFLTPGKVVRLEGVHVIRDNSRLFAGAQGVDAHGRLYANNTSVDIRMISPQLELNVSLPETAHRGEELSMAVEVKNSGNAPLKDITLSDSFGDVGKIPKLGPGESQALYKTIRLQETLRDDMQAIALDSSGQDVYASREIGVRVLKTGLAISGEPSVVTVYPGQPAEVTWNLTNIGEEMLHNITLKGSDGKRSMLRELPHGRSVRMAAICAVDETSWVNVTAKGMDQSGYPAVADGSVLVKAIKPGIGLKVTPAKLEICPGEDAKMSCLVANVGDDDLHDIALYQQGMVVATLDRLAPGDFRVVDTKTAVPDNSTISFQVSGKDSRGQAWSDSAEVDVDVVITALKIFASASPQSVVPGNASKITCTVANTGSIPLYSIFIISDAFGPLGTIDSLLPKRQKTVSAEKTVIDAVEDSISAEGFTQEKTSVRGLCQLKVDVLKLPGMQMQRTIQDDGDDLAGDTLAGRDLSDIRIRSVDVKCGDMNIPLNLPSEEETAVRVSQEIADEAGDSAKESSNQVLDGISRFISYVQKVLERAGGNEKAATQSDLEPTSEYGTSTSQELEASPDDGEDTFAARNYELSIESVKGSEHGAMRILDVSAVPSQPAAWERVKLSVHVKSSAGVRGVSARWGLSDTPLTRTDMLGVDRVYDMPMTLESGDAKDGYWSCTLPGNDAGTYMALSVWLTDESATAEGGPYMLHWSTVNSADKTGGKRSAAPQLENGMLFIESSSVKGKGEVSIKDTFEGPAMEFNEKMKGNGSISLESLRCIDKRAADNFTEKKDLVFTDGQLKGNQRVSSPTFHGGLGASVTERFNLSHVDKSETSSVSAAGTYDNTLAFNTEQAFDGTWNIQTQYAKFYKKIKADQQYTGSFQTEKKIKFQDSGQK